MTQRRANIHAGRKRQRGFTPRQTGGLGCRLGGGVVLQMGASLLACMAGGEASRVDIALLDKVPKVWKRLHPSPSVAGGAEAWLNKDWKQGDSPWERRHGPEGGAAGWWLMQIWVLGTGGGANSECGLNLVCWLGTPGCNEGNTRESSGNEPTCMRMKESHELLLMNGDEQSWLVTDLESLLMKLH